MVYVPDSVSFRVYAGGWEADGVNRDFGDLMDQNSPCNCATKAEIRKKMSNTSPLALRGCLDDPIGTVHAMHNRETLQNGGAFKTWSDGDIDEDICVFSKGTQEKVFWLKYKITRIGGK